MILRSDRLGELLITRGTIIEGAINMAKLKKPKRIQRKRTKGWKMPPNTVSVSRPGKWGNPFVVSKSRINNPEWMEVGSIEESVQYFQDMMADPSSHKVKKSVYNRFMYMRNNIQELKSKNLACWCKENSPCHGNVLLQLANS